MREKTEQEEKKNSFVFYESWYEGAKYLKGKHRLSYLEAIINYGLYGEEVETKGVENALFCAIKPTIKFNRKQKANGLQGGGTEGNSNASKTTQKPPKNDPNPTIFINDKDNDLYIDKKKEEEDKGKSSVVVGLVDFLSNWWDVNLTPAQVALIDSKPADYWEHFKDEVEASKWLKQQDLGKVFALHRNVVDGQYRTFKDTTPPPVPTYTPPKEPEFTPREQAIIDEFNAWRKDNPDLIGVYVYLKQLAEKHGGIPDKVYRALGMIYYAKSWHFK